MPQLAGQPFEFAGVSSSGTVLVSEDHQQVTLLIREQDNNSKPR
jgi:hypothetical protein